jgi:hypothetical protein
MDFQVYPNPTSNYFYFESSLPNATFTLLNLHGSVVKEMKNESYIDCSDLSSGTYIVRLESNGHFKFKKIILF